MKKLVLLLMCLCLVGCKADNAGGNAIENTSVSSAATAAEAESESVAETETAAETTAEVASDTETMSVADVTAEMSETSAVSEISEVTDSAAAETTNAAETTIAVETTTAETTAAETTAKTTAVSAEKVSAEEIVIEAEDAKLYGGLKTEAVDGFSGGEGIGCFENNSQYVEFTVDIGESGVYNLTFTGKGIGSDKENNISVDGKNVGAVKHLNEKKSDSTVTNVMLDKGEHKITLTSSWGWIYLDKMTVEAAKGISEEIYDVTPELINPDATAETKALFRFLCDNYGEKIISGQVCDYGVDGPEFKAIKAETGKYPAMLGLDMMDYSPSRTALGAKGSSVDVAIDFSTNHGGIVAYCWHWNAPTEYLKDGSDENGNPRWWGGFYTRNTDFDIAKVMDGMDPEGKKLLDRDIEEIAKQLNKLEEKGVPVLWRPLHEASGGWFWWGAKGADAYKKLWVYLYEQLTDVYGCDNLIWVYNGQSAEWYPGDEYVDIIGEDIYTDKRNYQPQTSKFAEAAEYSDSNKIVALTENGVLFDVEDAFAANTKWAWFNTWCGDFAVKNSKYNEEYTDKAMLKEVYGSDKVLTLDELPDLKNYK
ncbi:MAG: beta-mannanase [Oscillospiraceae bacterium]|nr:beta-mannanase [Oscillospiraceae bacterium]